LRFERVDPVHTPDGLELPMRRASPPAGSRGSVLLVHGASAGADMFLVPAGRSLGDWLASAGLDVWLVDWRGGSAVSERYARSRPPDDFTLDAIAAHDFAACFDHIRRTLDREGRRPDLAVVAHCVGGGALSMAIARHDVARVHGVRRVVLLTLGLFFVQPFECLLKAGDYVLERVERKPADCLLIHPDADRHPWPRALEAAFRIFPRALLPSCSRPFCRRVAFLYGPPYDESTLAPGIHDDLPRRFGSIHRTLFTHCSQNVRRGIAAPFGEPVGAGSFESQLTAGNWSGLDVTLVTGDRNRLWDRESIDRMHEYLGRKQAGAHSRKIVFSRYGHSDLLWGPNASEDVFPSILKGVAPD
jgi:cholesterol oxidase